MSHPDEHYDHPIEHHDPQEGFDHTEPNTPAIWLFTIGSIVGSGAGDRRGAGLFRRDLERSGVRQGPLVPSEQLQEVRNRDEWDLTHYMYGNLQIDEPGADSDRQGDGDCSPQEAAAGKLFYPAKPTVPK